MTKIESENVILKALADPTVALLPVRRAMITYLRQAHARAERLLNFVDSWFAKTIGVLFLARLVVDFLLSHAAFHASVVDRITRFSHINLIADPLAALIFISWCVSKTLHRNVTYAAASAVPFMTKRLLHTGGQNYMRSHIVRAVVCFSRVPDQCKYKLLSNISTIAFNRWTRNATHGARLNFFSGLANRFPSGLWIALELDGIRKEITTYGYCAYVPLSIPNYLQHRNAQVNLYDQDQSFILSQSEVDARLAAYQTQPVIDKGKDGLAVYILGMNVSGGLEKSHGQAVIRKLKEVMGQFLRQFPNEQPAMYCVTTIPSVMGAIKSSGFFVSGRTDINGDKFWELDMSPSPERIELTDKELSSAKSRSASQLA